MTNTLRVLSFTSTLQHGVVCRIRTYAPNETLDANINMKDVINRENSEGSRKQVRIPETVGFETVRRRCPDLTAPCGLLARPPRTAIAQDSQKDKRSRMKYRRGQDMADF